MKLIAHGESSKLNPLIVDVGGGRSGTGRCDIVTLHICVFFLRSNRHFETRAPMSLSWALVATQGHELGSSHRLMPTQHLIHDGTCLYVECCLRYLITRFS